MSSPVYSTRFSAGQVTSTAITSVYTVPTGNVLTLRQIDIVSHGSGTNTFFYVLISGIGFLVTLPVTTLWQHASWSGMQVLNAGEVLAVQGPGFACDYALTGYLLSM